MGGTRLRLLVGGLLLASVVQSRAEDFRIGCIGKSRNARVHIRIRPQPGATGVLGADVILGDVLVGAPEGPGLAAFGFPAHFVAATKRLIEIPRRDPGRIGNG